MVVLQSCYFHVYFSYSSCYFNVYFSYSAYDLHNCLSNQHIIDCFAYIYRHYSRLLDLVCQTNTHTLPGATSACVRHEAVAQVNFLLFTACAESKVEYGERWGGREGRVMGGDAAGDG